MAGVMDMFGAGGVGEERMVRYYRVEFFGGEKDGEAWWVDYAMIHDRKDFLAPARSLENKRRLVSRYEHAGSVDNAQTPGIVLVSEHEHRRGRSKDGRDLSEYLEAKHKVNPVNSIKHEWRGLE